jgi:hypothetical protein
MTDSTDSIFLQLAQVQDRDSAIAAAAQLADYFRDRGEFHRLFEARKFAARLKAGVAPFYFQRPPEMSPAQAAAIEAELLLACREVGAALASSGHPGAAWTYLQPLDDLNFVRELLEQTPRHEESLAELIQICLFERAHPEFGYSLVLQELGTCQAISAFDSAAPALDRDQRIRLAEKLIGHMHRELGANVRNAVIRARPELASELDSAGLGELLERFRDEVRQSTPHLDATHLVSAMRIGRQAGELESLQQGLDLARYGQLLPGLLQYASEPPFAETYPDHERYFSALVSGDANAAVAHFCKQAALATSGNDRVAALELAIDLLLRTGKREAAAEIALSLGRELGSAGISPGLIEIGSLLRNPGDILAFLQAEHDVLAYAAIRLNQAMQESTPPPAKRENPGL